MKAFPIKPRGVVVRNGSSEEVSLDYLTDDTMKMVYNTVFSEVVENTIKALCKKIHENDGLDVLDDSELAEMYVWYDDLYISDWDNRESLINMLLNDELYGHIKDKYEEILANRPKVYCVSLRTILDVDIYVRATDESAAEDIAQQVSQQPYFKDNYDYDYLEWDILNIHDVDESEPSRWGEDIYTEEDI